MARISQISELEARKRALVTESELSREALKAEVQNLQAYCDGFFKKVDRIRSFGPWLMFAAPMAIPLVRMFSGRKSSNKVDAAPPIKGRFATLMLGWRLYRQYAPLLKSVASQLLARRGAARERRSSAAEV